MGWVRDFMVDVSKERVETVSWLTGREKADEVNRKGKRLFGVYRKIRVWVLETTFAGGEERWRGFVTSLR